MKKRSNLLSTLRILLGILPYLKPYRLWVFLTILCAALNTVVRIGVSFLMKSLTDTALAGQSTEFVHLLYLSMALIAFSLTIGYVSVHAVARFETFITRDLRNHLAEQIQKMPISSLERYHSGDLVARQNDNIAVIVGYLSFVTQLVYQPLMLIVSVLFIGLINWKMLLIFGTITPLSAPLYDWISRPLQKLAQKLAEDQARANAVVEDTVRGVYVLKAFNLNDVLLGKYSYLADGLQKNSLSMQRLYAYILLGGQVLRYLPMLLSIVLGGYLTYQGEMSLGGLMAISTTMLWCTAAPVEALLSLIQRTREVIPVVERVLEILNHKVESAKIEAVTQRFNLPSIEFQGVTFAYTGRTPLLDNLSFKIETGEVVALVGPSGCGKSTVLKLLCGFYRATAGSICVYGNRLEESCPAAVRQLISIVSQDVYLFPVSIAENIHYGRISATWDDIIAGAKVANAHHFVMQFPEAYETPLREGAVNLSGGQKQCLAIARAVLKDAPILLLDEPTAALDTQSEAMVEEALDRFAAGRTVLLVAHRLSTIKNVDRILVLDRGRIVEEGTHATLMDTDGLYRRLYTKQLAEAIEPLLLDVRAEV